jgi:hypothetical protein
MGEVIEARQWRHTGNAANPATNRTASPYGSAPWVSENDRSAWTLEVTGYTIQHPDGTIGLGRPPFASKEEAQGWVDKHPNFPGMQQD